MMNRKESAKEQLWFQDVLVQVDVSSADGTDSISVLEFTAGAGAGTPLHIHHTHDEIFHVLEGEVTWHIAEQEMKCSIGDTLLAPRGIPHYYRVTSPRGARWLAITHGADFEGFVRALARPATSAHVPKPQGPPSPEAVSALKQAASEHGMELLTPPQS